MNAPIRIIVEGQAPRKNARGTIARDRTGNVRRITPTKTKAWRARLYESLPPGTSLVMGAGEPGGIKSGGWTIDIRVYESKERHLDVIVPLGDVDSSVAAILDALQPKVSKRRHKLVYTPGLLDDDARIVKATISKHYDKHRPRVEIDLVPVPEEWCESAVKRRKAKAA